jgi:hypothetical protein
MTYRIEEYINSISKCQKFDSNSCQYETYYDFSGDGQGDYEWYSNKTTKECLENYIEYCEKQIEIAKECLDIFKE